jgi:hypothetical protein
MLLRTPRSEASTQYSKWVPLGTENRKELNGVDSSDPLLISQIHQLVQKTVQVSLLSRNPAELALQIAQRTLSIVEDPLEP